MGYLCIALFFIIDFIIDPISWYALQFLKLNSEIEYKKIVETPRKICGSESFPCRQSSESNQVLN